MKVLILVITIATFTACDLQSNITKRSVEKYAPTPTPSIVATPTPVPVDPASIVQVDTSVSGSQISVNGPDQKKTVKCDKYNPVSVNGAGNTVTVIGACRQIMINGDRNTVTAEAVMEVVFNGTGNNLTYSKFPNGKNPVVIENKPGNTVQNVTSMREK